MTRTLTADEIGNITMALRVAVEQWTAAADNPALIEQSPRVAEHFARQAREVVELENLFAGYPRVTIIED